MIVYFFPVTALIERAMLAAIVDYCHSLRLPILLRSGQAVLNENRGIFVQFVLVARGKNIKA